MISWLTKPCLFTITLINPIVQLLPALLSCDAEIRVLLLSFKSRHPEADPAGYLVQELGLSSGGSTHGRHKVWLGLPISMSHIIDDDSPLHGMMPIDMDKEDTELLVLLDGVDATTSGILQAR